VKEWGQSEVGLARGEPKLAINSHWSLVTFLHAPNIWKQYLGNKKGIPAKTGSFLALKF